MKYIANQTVSIYVTAVLFVLITGCRPSEASYIVRANAVEPNTYPDFRPAKWVAKVPPQYNKTKRWYQWPVPFAMNKMVPMLQNFHKHEPQLPKILGTLPNFIKALDNWFSRRVLPDAVATENVAIQLESAPD